MDHEQLEENLSLYALGALEPDSAREVESHLATGCQACDTLLKQYQASVSLLPYALSPRTPPPHLKSKIMRAVREPPAAVRVEFPMPPPSPVQPVAQPAPPRATQIEPRQTWLSAHSPALAAALGGLLLGVGAYAAYLYVTLEAERTATVQDRTALAKAKVEISDLKTRLSSQQAALGKATTEWNRAVEALGTTHELLARHQEQIETLQAQLQAGRGAKERYRTDVAQAGGEDLVRILTSPTAKMASLSGTDVAKEAYAMVFVEPDTHRGFFYANNLPALPAGKTYQLWVITDKPVSAGVFTLDAGYKGRVMLRDIPDINRIKKFAVSLEPKGGRPQPTGGIYLAGAL